ncbi:MFS transporter [Yeosuana sp. MJ-SS3]|uniref:MFS transporter n=1 Tax=Gilvirhabdus luticola TaxID=3079858 RepID=A0ABU3U7A1_9FLAO|nr:MFS transporter [Yeosuana sp. MJ-SS3]MDU8886265.1 MFS transporter [Yeosuana sp. MJ-SS3]
MNSESWKVKLALLLVSSLTIMSMITISASLPDMTKTFSDVPNGGKLVKMVLSFPGLFIALSAIAAGLVIDKIGRLKLLGVALVLYAISGTSGYWLDNLYAILAGRALLGISVGITMTIVTTLVADYYHGKARQKFAGIQIAVMSLAGIIFISLGGILADINWRVPFLLYLFSILIIPFAYLYLKEPLKAEDTHQEVKTVKSPKIIWFVFANVMLMWIMFFIIPIQIPFYLKSIGVEKNSLIGLAIASSTFFSAIGAISFSKIKDKFAFKQIFGLGYLLMAIAYVCIAYGNSYAMVMVAMLLGGLGMGVMIPNANVWVMQLAPLEIRGREIGRLTTFWFMGQFLSPIILLPILDIVTQSQLYLIIAAVLLILSLIMLVFYFMTRKTESVNEL